MVYDLAELTNSQSGLEPVEGEPGVYRLWLEAVRPSDTGPKLIHVLVDPDGNGEAADFMLADSVRVKPELLLLGIDSNNDGTISPEDDPIEDHSDKPGKLALISDGDADNDGIPDFADGFNLFNEIAEDDASPPDLLIEVQLKIGASLSSSDEIEIDYEASDPMQVQWTTTAPYQRPADGELRLWLTDTPETRLGTAFADGGDYLAPGVYTIAQLDPDGDGMVTLWAEALSTSSAMADRWIRATVTPANSAAITDQVRLTATAMQLLGRGYGDQEFTPVYHFVATDLSIPPQNGFTAGTYAIYKFRVLDPRTSGPSSVKFNDGQPIPLITSAAGVYETPEFVVLDPGAGGTAPTSYVVYLNDGDVYLSYNPGKKRYTKFRAKVLKSNLRTPEVALAETQIGQIETQLKAEYDAGGWVNWISNASDPGRYGKELHKRFSQWVDGEGAQSRWMRDVYVSTNTNKVVWVGDNVPGNIQNDVNVQQIDALCVSEPAQGQAPIRFVPGDDWNLNNVHSVYEIKSGGGPTGNQRVRYIALTDGGKKLFIEASQYRWKPGSGLVANNRRTVLTYVLSALGAAAGATTVGAMINGEYLGLFDDAMVEADNLMLWTAKMVSGNATQNDKFTYPHKVVAFYSAVNNYAERLVDGMWDIDGSRIAEKIIVEQMYLEWVSP